MTKIFMVFTNVVPAGLAEVEGRPVTVLTAVSATAKTEAATVAASVNAKIARALERRCPYSGDKRHAQFAAVLENRHLRDLLGGNASTEELSNLGSALGVTCIIHTSLMMEGRNIIAASVIIDAKSGRAATRKAHNLGSGDDALKAATGFAEDLASEFSNALPFSPCARIFRATVH